MTGERINAERSAEHTPNQALNGEWLIFAVTLLLVLAMAARTPVDSDLWWHLRSGEETVRAGQPLAVDTFSYTRSGQPWINHSWLAEVGMYGLFRLGGYRGLGAAVALLAAACMALIYLRMQGRAVFRAFLIVFGAVVMAPVWSPRPQMLSLLFLSALAWALQRHGRGSRDFLWWLPLFFGLWANLHGGYVLGLILLGLWLAGEALDYFLEPQALNGPVWPRVRRLALWSGASLLAVLINPYGVGILRVPFQTVGVAALQRSVVEWASPDFHEITQQPFLWLLLVLIAAVGLSGRRMRGVELLAVIGFGYLALMARRNIGPFVIVSLPVLGRHLCLAYDAWRERIARAAVTPPGEKLWRSFSAGGKPLLAGNVQRVINLAIIGLLTAAAATKLYLVTQPTMVQEAIAAGYPAGAVRWLEENQPEGRMLSEYQWGGYLSWFGRGYPVFVDGRTDLFGDEIIGQWLQVIQAEGGWQEILERWQVRLILLEPGRPLLKELPQMGWRMLYQDRQAVLYGR